MNTQELLNTIRTPEKSDSLLLAPSYEAGAFDSHAVDCPFPFFHDGRFWMTYIGWVMFYFRNCSDGHARDGVAFSEGLIHWQKGNEAPIDVGPPGSIDSTHAHKPGIIAKDGQLYHFYCAVAPSEADHLGEIKHNEVCGITIATVGGST